MDKVNANKIVANKVNAKKVNSNKVSANKIWEQSKGAKKVQENVYSSES